MSTKTKQELPSWFNGELYEEGGMYKTDSQEKNMN